MKSFVVFCLCFGLISALHLDSTYERLIKKRLRMRTHGRIVGGTPAAIADHPWQLAFYDTGYFFCGAVIVAERYVLTAAHCVEDYPPISDITFRAGNANREQGQSIRILHYDIHQDYDSDFLSHDIAVVTVFERFNFGSNIQPVQLAARGFEAAHGSDSMVTGWGYTSSGQLPTALQQVSVPVVSAAACEQMWPGWLDNTMVCAGTSGRDSCKFCH